MTIRYVTKMFDRLDRICDLVYGTANRRVVEMVLDQVPGLEAYGIVLPHGLILDLPDLDLSTQQAPTIKQIQLWG